MTALTILLMRHKELQGREESYSLTSAKTVLDIFGVLRHPVYHQWQPFESGTACNPADIQNPPDCGHLRS